MKNLGFFRVRAAVPAVSTANVAFNERAILETMRQASADRVELLVLPELCVTGYTCGDLFGQRTLLEGAEAAVKSIVDASANMRGLITIVGVPVSCRGALYNCAAVVSEGQLLGLVPKTFLPNYAEFYEKRWFTSAAELDGDLTIEYAGETVLLSTDQIFEKGDARIGVEICEDLWSVIPPSSRLALKGANIIANLSASNEAIGKHDYLTGLIASQSARCRCIYVYASAGFGESSTDLVYSGNAIIAENGHILRQSPRFTAKPLSETADADLEILEHDRNAGGSFSDSRSYSGVGNLRFRSACFLNTGTDSSSAKENEENTLTAENLLRDVDPEPFVPSSEAKRTERCSEIISIQTEGLMRRLTATHCRNLVVGISGGLDSTLALLIAVNAFDRLDIDRKGITGVTMPGFGTTERTHTNADTIMERLGVSIREISIVGAVRQHFKDIGHDENVHDVTYENSQARERTMLLMDIANSQGGMVVGTGDMSELALGWATYNGDHMSMYGVNASVPKTLVKYLVKYFADEADDSQLREALLDILATPISPELLPADAEGDIAQKTEDLVGPYPLHDFFLYNMIRYGFSPRKIYLLARKAFGDRYSSATIKHWLQVFLRRFFNQQFKRSCLPDGPKVGSICLSPRGDWRMPSDASSALWLAEADSIEI